MPRTFRAALACLVCALAHVLPQPGPARAGVFYVSPGAGQDRGAGGSPERPFSDLEAALRSLGAGDELVLMPGVYEGSFAIDERCRSGSAESPIRVAARPGAKLWSSASRGAAVLVKRDYWTFEGIDLTPGRGGAVAFTTVHARGVRLLESHVHDGARNGVAIGPGSEDITIAGCHIHDFDAGERDAHGVAVLPGTKRIVIRENHIHHNSGDAIQVVGPEQLPTDPEDPGGQPLAPAEDVRIEENDLHEDRENAVDVKTARRVKIAGNRMRGYAPVSTSHGEAILVHNGAEDVTIEKNRISQSAIGISVGRGRLPGGTPPSAPRRVVVTENVLESEGATGETAGVAVVIARDVTVSKNVIRGWAVALLFLGNEGELGGLAITGNTVLDAGKLAFRISRLSAAARFEGNSFSGAAPLQRCRVGDEETDVASLVAAGRLPPGNLAVSETPAR